ncbi:MAG: M48 family metallopeptidase [Alphaproteobacteria bacterium]|nr:M48 family metallopeptidase [Alphaproteobacteria bacterium]
MTTGPAIYFDGLTSARHDVTVEATPEVLRIRAADGAEIAEWRYQDLRHQSAPDHVLRLGRTGDTVLARLEVHDPTLAHTIDEHADTLDRTGAAERRVRTRVIVWSFAAAVSLVLVGIFGLPALADRIAPLVPLSVEHKFGLAVDAQVRSMLNPGSSKGPFECGLAAVEKPGRAALDNLVKRMETAAGLPIPLKVAVVRRADANAIALPGGHIYVFQGLINRTRSADELAGVIAHEIGHVANRDGTRSVLQAAGLSFLFGVLLGDFTGGGVVVIAARSVMQKAYSREVETAADRYGVRLMGKIGGDVRAFGSILGRIAGGEPGISILQNHPLTKDRIAAVNAAAGDAPAPAQPLLTPAEWADLKQICG